MAFIISSGVVVSFAEADDVRARDQRVFEQNEGFDDITIEDMLTRSTDRIMSKLKASDWWREYNNLTRTGTLALADLPAPDRTKIERQADFTELCVSHTLKEYLYPRIADFGNEGSAEVSKINFYQKRFDDLWLELLASGDFYDLNDDGTVESSEKNIRSRLTRRTRGRRSIAMVR